jgi:hypothetical protein
MQAFCILVGTWQLKHKHSASWLAHGNQSTSILHPGWHMAIKAQAFCILVGTWQLKHKQVYVCAGVPFKEPHAALAYVQYGLSDQVSCACLLAGEGAA